jgi:hypothetical protein
MPDTDGSHVTVPLTFARTVNCPGGLPVERARSCGFLTDPDVARFLARLHGEGFDVVIAPDSWRPPPPPECPSGYLLTLLCPAAADYRRVSQLRLGWISARGGKWHRATGPRPTFTRDETAACGFTFRPLNVTWDGERPPTTTRYLCKRPGCRDI